MKRAWLPAFAVASAVAACVQNTELFPDATGACAVSAPPLQVGDAMNPLCAGAVAAQAARFALCTCEDLVVTRNLSVRSGRSMSMVDGGAAREEGRPEASTDVVAAVGSDGDVRVSAATMIAGALIAVGNIELGGRSHIFGNLRSGGAVETAMTDDTVVHGDGFIAGSVTGSLEVLGTLHVGARAEVGEDVRAETISRDSVPRVEPPCNCSAPHTIDIGEAVARRAQVNANRWLNFDATRLEDLDSSTTVNLACGEYHFDRIRTQPGAALELRVRGRTAIFVAGDVSLGDNLIVTLEPEATLDIFVAGSFLSTGRVIGAPTAAARVHLWVGSTSVSLSDQVQFGAVVYAPAAVLTAGAGARFTGALFVGALSISGDVRLTYDPAAALAGSACGTPRPDPPQ